MVVRIIGAGFSGLAIGYALTQRGVSVELHEKSSRVGGLLGSQRLEWGLVESAANGLRSSAPVLELFQDLKLDFLQMKKENRKRYIFRGRPRQIPLSPLEMTRMSVGFLRRPRPQPGQSLQSYAESVFGYGAARYLIEPALFGVFADRSENLSATLIYDYFFKYKSKKSNSVSGTVAPEDGMEQLVSSLAQYIQENGGKIHLNSSADLLEDGITVVATDATAAADLLESKDEWVSSQLKRIRYLSLNSVTLGFSNTKRSLKGFGCLFPHDEKFNSLGVLFNNDIFDSRGPYNTETWMLKGGSDATEADLLAQILEDRVRLVGIEESPDETSFQLWPRALPQYSLELEKVLQSLVLPSCVHLVGNYLGRMGLAKILDQCHEIADRIVKNES